MKIFEKFGRFVAKHWKEYWGGLTLIALGSITGYFIDPIFVAITSIWFILVGWVLSRKYRKYRK